MPEIYLSPRMETMYKYEMDCEIDPVEECAAAWYVISE
jgi:hypothetical protein